ncbi:hypothetical protein B0H11DRAFT_2421935 [Mycena galericulata]|nr:hypothetical protein B0H11DRAFT_2421935 [Mycena galericulata]
MPSQRSRLTHSVTLMRSKISTLGLLEFNLEVTETAHRGTRRSLGVGSDIGGNDANFILVPILKEGKPHNTRAQRLYRLLGEENGVVVRYRGYEPGCEGCLSVTVGTEEENRATIPKMREVLSVI